MQAERTCPGCGLQMPMRVPGGAHGYYHASPECWSVYTEVLDAEYSNAALFGNVHQLTVDAYAVQHAGGDHPDKSVAVHLIGLYLVYERHVRSPSVAPQLQQLATSVKAWSHFEPPKRRWDHTVADVALVAGIPDQHLSAVRAWSNEVWDAWSEHHFQIAAFAFRHISERSGQVSA